MHCQTCDYPLWDNTARICPECGTPFSLHDFQFRPGAVRFCCPHCRQNYYGTSPTGHLEPESFACVRCARDISMEQMAVVPVEGIGSPLQDGGSNPWLTDKTGIWSRWWRTLRTGFARPSDLGRGTSPSSTVGSAIAYALVNFAIVLTAAFIPAFLISGVLAGFMVGAGAGGAGAAAILGTIAAQQAVSFVTIFIGIFLWAGVAHLVLRMTGEHRGGFVLTLGAVCYSSGCYIIALVPCIGAIAAVYWVVVSGIMLASAQRVSGVRAAAATCVAVLLPAVVCIGGSLGIGGMTALTGAMRGPGFTVPAAPNLPMDPASRAARIQSAIESRYTQTGSMPDHPGRFLADQTLEAADFAADPMVEKLSGLTLTEFILASESEIDRAIMDERRGGRTDIGDVLFGPLGDEPWRVPLDTSTEDLWLFIITPELGRPLTRPIIVVTSKGPVTVQPERFESLRASQNAVRAGLKLPPFPDPTRVIRP